MPQHRNNGIGSGILQRLLDEATEDGKPVRIWVENWNPSFRLLERLGFKLVDDKDIDWQHEPNLHLEWLPAA